MKQIDVQAGSFIDAALDFGDSAVVYHTVYFAQQQVAQQLNMWLLDPKARAGLQARSGVLAMLPSIHRPFTRMRYHAAVRTQRAVPPQPRRMTRAARKRELRGATRESTAKLARAASSHLDALFGTRHATKPSALARPASATAARNYAPKLRQTTSERSRTRDKRDVHVVSYEQLHRSIPIFGTRVNVELDAAGQLIAAGAKLAQVSGVSRTPKLSERRAGAALAAELKLSSAEARALTKQKAALSFFYERTTKTWHLTYCFANVPARPPSNSQRSARSAARAKHKRDGHGIGPGPRQRFPRYDYLVDANAGALVYYYSRTPTAAKRAAPGKIPGRLRGIDDEGVMQTFFGLQTAAGFELRDPARCIRTHDLAGGDADTVPVPRRPISSLKPSFGQEAGAGVSAHVNSGHVFDFYNSVLFRNGIDDKGMEVVNVVNCTSPADEPPPQWDNACWYLNKMWYGQTIDRGKKRSYARYLDIIGHELTHGVTEKTCDLVYREESGALNESFSDIFGVIINNWIKARAADVRDWDWEIGPGLGETKNKPLRNMANPKLTGDPAHVREMSQLDPGEKPNDDNDLGYVHTNSNVHNKAAYNVLTASAAGAKGKRRALVFAPEDVARLYYYALQRIDRTADFEDVYFTLLQVVRTYYPDESEQTGKCAAITAAYAAVGIPRTR
jgi:Zn-dependent metalloprotease